MEFAYISLERITMKKRIIIIEDDETIKKTFSLILKDYDIEVFSSGEEAIREINKLSDGTIQLVITDYKLPGINGIKFIEALKKRGYKGKIILISAYPNLIGVEDLVKTGIDCFFVKPLELDKLIESIKNLLS